MIHNLFLKSGKQSKAFYVEPGVGDIISHWLEKISGDISSVPDMYYNMQV